MEEIKVSIDFEDNTDGPTANVVNNFNKIGDSADETTDAIKKMGREVDKTINESTGKLGDFVDISTEQRLQWVRLAEGQKIFQEETRKSLRWLRSFGVDIDKVARRLALFRTQLILKAEALLKVSDSLEESTGFVNEFGNTWGSVLNVLSTKFPKVTKAIVGGLRAIRIALISTGIGALVVAVGLLVSALAGLSSAFGDVNKEITNTEKIANAFKATFGGIGGLFSQIIQNTKDVINGQKSLGEALKDNISAYFGLAGAIKSSAEALNNATIATNQAIQAEVTLKAAIAASKDALNQQREAAADANKTATQRIAAIRQAATIEESLEQQRLKVLELNKRAAEERFRAEKIQGKEAKAAAEDVLKATQELQFARAEANARQRSDQAAINNLLRESSEELKRLREEYAALLKDLGERLQAARLEELIGADRIKAELAIAIEAIDEFEKRTQEAARRARQPFDATPFAELRLLAEKKAAQELRDFEAQEGAARIERERQRLALLGQTLSASFDEALNLQEAQQAFVLESERQALEQRLGVRQKFYKDSGKLQDEAAQAEIEQLRLNIELVQQKELELRQKARERRLSEQLQSVQLDAEVRELELQLIQRSGDRTLTAEQFIEKERLKNQADAIQKRIELLEEFYGPDSPEVRLLRGQLAVIEREITDFAKSDVVNDFFRNLFQIDEKQLAFVGGQFRSAFANITAAAEQFTQIQIEQGRRRIDALSREIGEKEKLLEKELRDKEQGYANDYELYRRQLETLTAERDRVAQENLEKEKKIANVQLAINSAQQASEYVLAAIRFFSTGGQFGPIVGVALALGAIGILASTVAQARANAERFKEVPRFREGGPVDGALHAFGGRKIEVEGGEYIVSREPAARHGDFLAALNAGKYDSVDLGKLLESRFDIAPTLKKMEKDREVIVNLGGGIDYGVLEEMYTRTLGKVSGDIISYLKTRPVEKLDSEGNPVKEWTEGNNIRRQRVRSQKNAE